MRTSSVVPGKEPPLIPATWRHRRLSDLTRNEAAELHPRVGRDSGHYTANRGLALLHTMFSRAHTWGLCADDNAATRIRALHEEKRDPLLAPRTSSSPCATRSVWRSRRPTTRS